MAKKIKAITEFDRTNLKEIRAELDAALKAVGDKFGIVMKSGGFSFSADSFNTKITAVTKESMGGQDDNPLLAGVPPANIALLQKTTGLNKLFLKTISYGTPHRPAKGVVVGLRASKALVRDAKDSKVYLVPVFDCVALRKAMGLR